MYTHHRCLICLITLCTGATLGWMQIRVQGNPLESSLSPGSQPATRDLSFTLVPLPRHDDALAREMINSIGMVMVRIEPGSFMMGSPLGERERHINEVQHEVEITRPFYIGKFEVTQNEYELITGNNPSEFQPKGKSQARVMGLDTRRFPVECVSWNDAKEYCRKLTQRDRQEGKIRPDMEYTLPTEAEFEYCLRAETKTAFYFGETITTDQVNYNGTLIYGDGKKGIYRDRTVEVGSFKPNNWGLYDMHGNVTEWCEDWYDTDHGRKSPLKDPRGAAEGQLRVVRGGSFLYHPRDCRCACLDGIGPGSCMNFIGFRVVLRFSSSSN